MPIRILIKSTRMVAQDIGKQCSNNGGCHIPEIPRRCGLCRRRAFTAANFSNIRLLGMDSLFGNAFVALLDVAEGITRFALLAVVGGR